MTRAGETAEEPQEPGHQRPGGGRRRQRPARPSRPYPLPEGSADGRMPTRQRETARREDRRAPIVPGEPDRHPITGLDGAAGGS
jgi:hypothetical protein